MHSRSFEDGESETGVKLTAGFNYYRKKAVAVEKWIVRLDVEHIFTDFLVPCLVSEKRSHSLSG